MLKSFILTLLLPFSLFSQPTNCPQLIEYYAQQFELFESYDNVYLDSLVECGVPRGTAIMLHPSNEYCRQNPVVEQIMDNYIAHDSLYNTYFDSLLICGLDSTLLLDARNAAPLTLISSEFILYDSVDVPYNQNPLIYRIDLPETFDPLEEYPVLIYFHGNNPDMARNFFPDRYIGKDQATEKGFIGVSIKAPTRYISGKKIQLGWVDEDEEQVAQLLLSGFDGKIKVNTSQVYFSGGSQGTCFLNNFITSHGEHFGGGYFMGCGCINLRDNIRISDKTRENVRIWEHGSTEDFLWSSTLTSYEYYKYEQNMEVYSDFSRSGDHCTLVDKTYPEALDWLMGDESAPEQDIKGYWIENNITLNFEADKIHLATGADSTLFFLKQFNDIQNLYIDSFQIYMYDPILQSEQYITSFDRVIESATSSRSGQIFVQIKSGSTRTIIDVTHPTSPIELFTAQHSFGLFSLTSGDVALIGENHIQYFESITESWSEPIPHSLNQQQQYFSTREHVWASTTNPDGSVSINATEIGLGDFQLVDAPDGVVKFTVTDQFIFAVLNDHSIQRRTVQNPTIAENWENVSLPPNVIFGSYDYFTSIKSELILNTNSNNSPTTFVSYDNGSTWERQINLTQRQLLRKTGVTNDGRKWVTTSNQLYHYEDLTIKPDILSSSEQVTSSHNDVLLSSNLSSESSRESSSSSLPYSSSINEESPSDVTVQPELSQYSLCLEDNCTVTVFTMDGRKAFDYSVSLGEHYLNYENADFMGSYIFRSENQLWYYVSNFR